MHNIYWPCQKCLDLHWTLTVSVRYHSDLFQRLDVKVYLNPKESIQVFIVDHKNIEILRIFSPYIKWATYKIKQDLHFKNSPKIYLGRL